VPAVQSSYRTTVSCGRHGLVLICCARVLSLHAIVSEQINRVGCYRLRRNKIK
jgi:hypothetical protein